MTVNVVGSADSVVTKFNTRSGAVALTKADVTGTGLAAADVGADVAGAAATALTTETSRAEAAEALLAPLASPALTGTPTAPTKTALTNNTDIATTAYADAAVAVEVSRAGTAEALLAPKASPALTGSPTAPTQTALDSSTKIGTTAYADLAVGVEKARALAAEALLIPAPGPATYGYLGWNVDPLVVTANAAAGSSGFAAIVRVRCVTSGVCGHIGYSIQSPGSALTTSQSWVVLYDTGQASAGNITRLGISADQSAVWTTAAVYQTALTSPPTLTAGQDYFVMIVTNGGTPPNFNIISTRMTFGNIGLTGIASRSLFFTAGGLTTPASSYAIGSFSAAASSNLPAVVLLS